MKTKLTDRQQIWLAAWKTVANCENCTTSTSASKWANQCLQDFDAKFPEVKQKESAPNPLQPVEITYAKPPPFGGIA